MIKDISILKIVIPVKDVLSENFLYRPSFNKVRGSSYLRLSPEIAEYKNYISEFIISNYDLSFLKDTIVTGIVSEYRFFLEKNFFSRDVTNMLKSVEDSLFSVFRKYNSNLDDSLVLSNTITKIFDVNSRIEIIFLFFKNQDFNLYFKHSIFKYIFENIL